jgi:hypothetical protein
MKAWQCEVGLEERVVGHGERYRRGGVRRVGGEAA